MTVRFSALDPADPPHPFPATVILDGPAAPIPGDTVVLQTGFDAPFPLLSDEIIHLILELEAERLAGVGANVAGLFVDRWWDRRLIEICGRLRIPAIVSPRVLRPGVLSHFHHTIAVYDGEQVGPEESEPFPETPPGGPAHIDETPVVFDPDDLDLQLLLLTYTRAMSRVPGRVGNNGRERLAAAVDGAAFLPTATSEERLDLRRELLTLRAALDQDQRRSWGRLRRVDWDADGVEEVEIETTRWLAILDAEAAALPTVADKTARWPLSSVPGEPGWMMARHVESLDQVTPTRLSLTVTGLEETKDRLVLSAETDHLKMTMVITDQDIAFEYRLEDMAPGLIGPELSLQLDDPTMRVDGSRWRPLDQPAAHTGHKFRVKGGDQELVLTSINPATLFVRPVEGGLVAWLHWTTDGTGRYQLRVG